jgi:uncharacterized protein YjbI with pentapeptide repeats
VAYQKDLALVNEGVAAWNRWRDEHRELKPDLSGADLRGAALSGVDLSETDLSDTDLRKADLRKAYLRGAALSRANLSAADLTTADLQGAYLIQANLSGANVRGANLNVTRLNGANLMDANLHVAKLRLADLSGADLSGADLNGADLSGVNLSGVDISGATAGGTIFACLDLSLIAKGLDSIKHNGPSTIGIDTLYMSRGMIPDAFLRGAGVPDNFIAYIGSLVGKPIEFYSCFISYSTKDQEFAERLHADLQAKGVRCWFAPQDLKIGDKFRDRIDESIRLHDKLLIVLSEQSIASAWVRREVEAAFEREDRQKSIVLFPIRVDDAVMQTKEAWAADIRRTRHIGDFSQWMNHDSYTKAFDRLLRDLKAETNT